MEVEIPAGIPPERRETLASKVALARILATTENPDAPEEDACAEYRRSPGSTRRPPGGVGRCKTKGVSGKWSLGKRPRRPCRSRGKARGQSRVRRLEPEDLDEMVHELASSVPADINNGGMEEQVRYLVKGLGAEQTERQIDELIEEQQGGE